MKYIKLLLLAVFGFIAAFAVCEILLSAVSAVYKYGAAARLPSGSATYGNIVLCLGDSYTYGVGAPSGASYPCQLEKLLNDKSTKKYRVINGGIPGCNSGQLLRHLRENLDKYRPDIVLVLIGLNDRNCLTETNSYMFAGDKKLRAIYRIEALLCASKTFKLALSCVSGIASRVHRPAAAATAPEPFNAELEKCIAQAHENYEMCRVGPAKGLCEQAIKMSPRDHRGYFILGELYLHRTGETQKAAEYLEHSLALRPEAECFCHLFIAYYRLGDARNARKALVGYLALNPQELKNYWGLLLHTIPAANDNDIFTRMTTSNLDDIVNTIKKYNARIILMDYPQDTELRQNAAQKNATGFIYNCGPFRALALLPGYKREQYFVDDGHCTERGYGVMAANACRVILKN